MREGLGIKSKVSCLWTSAWVMYPLFLAALIIACIAIGLSGKLWSEQGDCSLFNCSGVITNITTDNNTFSPYHTLVIAGSCGTYTYVNGSGDIIIADTRLTPYLVGPNGTCSEFATPQEAYNQAIADGRGGDGVPETIILIKPGTYSFGTTLFPITKTGISFVGLSGTEGVIFSADSTSGGISVTTMSNTTTNVIFNGITFGDPFNTPTNGFLLQILSGNTEMYECNCINSNFRITLGGGTYHTNLKISRSLLRPLAPADFITSLTSDVGFRLELSIIFAVNGTQGGSLFNMNNGFNVFELLSSRITISFYNGLLAGPLSATYTVQNAFIIRDCTIENIVAITPYPNYIVLQQGNINMNFESNIFDIQGRVIYQNTNSTTTDSHMLVMADNQVSGILEIVRYEVNETITIGQNNFQFVNNYFECPNVPDVVYIANATTGDSLNIVLTGSTLLTNSPIGGEYMLGPDPAITCQLTTGTSVSLNQATHSVGITNVVVLPTLAA